MARELRVGEWETNLTAREACPGVSRGAPCTGRVKRTPRGRIPRPKQMQRGRGAAFLRLFSFTQSLA